MYQHGLKRVLDFLLALCGLLVLWPVFVIIAAAIKIDDPGPVFFSQKRVGLHKRYFWLYKFRSMKVSTPDVPTHLLEHPEQYISKVGGFLRKYSLDELPQMINILLGQMAIIGPRARSLESGGPDRRAGQIRRQRCAPRSYRLGPDQRPGRTDD